MFSSKTVILARIIKDLNDKCSIEHDTMDISRLTPFKYSDRKLFVVTLTLSLDLDGLYFTTRVIRISSNCSLYHSEVDILNPNSLERYSRPACIPLFQLHYLSFQKRISNKMLFISKQRNIMNPTTTKKKSEPVQICSQQGMSQNLA